MFNGEFGGRELNIRYKIIDIILQVIVIKTTAYQLVYPSTTHSELLYQFRSSYGRSIISSERSENNLSSTRAKMNSLMKMKEIKRGAKTKLDRWLWSRDEAPDNLVKLGWVKSFRSKHRLRFWVMGYCKKAFFHMLVWVMIIFAVLELIMPMKSQLF